MASTKTSRWSAQQELAYYKESKSNLSEHWERICELENKGFFDGMLLLDTHGLLDRKKVSGKRILDLGAGEAYIGVTLGRLFEPEVVYCVDFVPKQMWAAAKKFGGQPRLKFVLANALDLPFADSAFDIVVSNLFYHHIPEKDALAREIYRVLAPGGTFSCQEPNPTIDRVFSHTKESANEAVFPARVLNESLAAAGFEETSWHYWWTRFRTSKARLLSPSYVVTARKTRWLDGNAKGPLLRRELSPTRFENLEADQSVLQVDGVATQLAFIDSQADEFC
jgi:SAM-dependent methyltransferase